MRAFSMVSFWTLCLLSSFSASLAYAGSSKSLFKNGVYAAAYGDLTLDKGDWNGESYSALRAKAGFQLLRYEFFGLSLGYQKNGFYSATRNWTRTQGSTSLDYRGPVLEFHILPESIFSASLAISSNEGYLFTKETDAATYPYRCATTCTIVLQRTKLNVEELTLQGNVEIARELYLTLGFGNRRITGRPSYEVYTADPALSTYESDPSGKWKGNESFFLVGLRGSQL